MRLLQLVFAAALAEAIPQARTDVNSAGSTDPKTGQPFTSAQFQASIDFTKTTANDVKNGPCKDFFLIVARGSMEGGNLGVTTGPMLCNKMRAKYGARLGCQGVDPKAYLAAIGDNGKPKGTADASIEAAVNEFKSAYAKCPKSLYVFSGYSQGAAVMHGAIPLLPQEIKKQIVGGATFGDTRNAQAQSSMEGLPKGDVLVICTKDDGVCWRGTPTMGHLVYTINGDVDRAVNFLSGKLDAAAKRG